MSNSVRQILRMKLIDNLDESESLEEMSQNLENYQTKLIDWVQLIWQQLMNLNPTQREKNTLIVNWGLEQRIVYLGRCYPKNRHRNKISIQRNL